MPPDKLKNWYCIRGHGWKAEKKTPCPECKTKQSWLDDDEDTGPIKDQMDSLKEFYKDR